MPPLSPLLHALQPLRAARRLFQHRHSVRWRLVGLVGLVVVGMLAANGYAWLQQRSHHRAQERAQLLQMQHRQLLELQAVYGEYRYHTLALLADAGEPPKTRAPTALRRERAESNLLAATALAQLNGPQRAALRADLETIGRLLPRTLTALELRGPEGENLKAELRARLEALHDVLDRWAQERARGMPTEAATTLPFADAGILAALLAVTVLLSTLLIRSIVRPLDILLRAAENLRLGDLETPLPEPRPDEIREIARALDRFRRTARRSDFLAYHDPLSGLPNRTRLQEAVQRTLEQAAAGREAMVFLYLGLQQLSMINETFGPPSGDEYIRTAARRLRACAPEEAQVFHLGGSHFVVLVAGLANDSRLVAHAERLARNLVADMSRPFVLQDQDVEMSVNVGVTTWPQDGAQYQDLLGNAHAALTQAKRRGRGHVQFYTRQITDKARSRLSLASQLRHAVEAGEFTVHYQPILDVLEQRPVATEALMRWRHPQRGLVMPSEFIEVAEETGVIHAMGDWCLAQSCLDSRHWQQAALPKLKLAVNLSARQLAEPGLVDTVEQTLSYAGLSPADLELEITESAVMQDPERAVRVLRHLKSLGITLTVDDFGTGYSSLAYLQRFPLDKIKIDRSFVARLNRRRKDELIIAATVGLAADLGLAVIAEGVETREQMEALRQLGCRYMQGFFFARSLSSEELQAWVRQPEHWIPVEPAVGEDG